MNPLEYIKERREYFSKKDLRNGWSRSESGPCCEKCAFSREADGRAVALKSLVGCRNPFQVASMCECHLPVREAVRAGIVKAHDQLIRNLPPY